MDNMKMSCIHTASRLLNPPPPSTHTHAYTNLSSNAPFQYCSYHINCIFNKSHILFVQCMCVCARLFPCCHTFYVQVCLEVITSIFFILFFFFCTSIWHPLSVIEFSHLRPFWRNASTMNYGKRCLYMRCLEKKSPRI